MGNDMKKSNWF